MKKLILITVLVGLIATPALANMTGPSLGWWEIGDPRTTHQWWDFRTGTTEADGLVDYDWEAQPTEDDNPGTSVAYVKADTWDGEDLDSMHPGFMDDERIDVILQVSNFQEPLNKYIFVDVWYVGELSGPWADGHGDYGPYTTVAIDPPCGSDADFGFRIYPNPEKEDIWFSILADGSAAKLYEITVDTICIPAPGAILLGGIGVAVVGWLRRRRTL